MSVLSFTNKIKTIPILGGVDVCAGGAHFLIQFLDKTVFLKHNLHPPEGEQRQQFCDKIK